MHQKSIIAYILASAFLLLNIFHTMSLEIIYISERQILELKRTFFELAAAWNWHLALVFLNLPASAVFSKIDSDHGTLHPAAPSRQRVPRRPRPLQQPEL